MATTLPAISTWLRGHARVCSAFGVRGTWKRQPPKSFGPVATRSTADVVVHTVRTDTPTALLGALRASSIPSLNARTVTPETGAPDGSDSLIDRRDQGSN